jgi:hypothetical protein
MLLDIEDLSLQETDVIRIRHNGKELDQRLDTCAAITDTKPWTVRGQRQQWTSATAQLPTAMSAKMWPSVLPDAACMAGSVAESDEVVAYRINV